MDLLERHEIRRVSVAEYRRVRVAEAVGVVLRRVRDRVQFLVVEYFVSIRQLCHRTPQAERASRLDLDVRRRWPPSAGRTPETE